MPSTESGESFDYDVFLSHSSADKLVVEEIAHRLLQESVRPFLDKWHLVPGDVWVEGLEEGLDASRTFAVFVGPNGIAPWQNEEMGSALDDRVRDRSRRVIPVLPPAAERPASQDLPRFLRRATWVDLSGGIDDNGFFDLPLSTAFQTGETVTIRVKKTGWRARYPVNGEITLPADLAKNRVPIELLPNGSKLFLTHDQIEALIEEISEESAREAQRSTNDDETQDFADAIRAWAEARGLDPEQTQQEVAAWVQEVQDKSQDPRRLGLAANFEKRFTHAANHFEAAAEHGLRRLEVAIEEVDRLRRQVVEDLRSQGDALSNAYRFRDAITAYERALDQTPRDQMPHLRAATQSDLACALWAEGIRCSLTESDSYLRASIEALRSTLDVYTQEGLSQDWAMTQNNLGVALQEQGIRTGGEKGRQLIQQGVTAYRSALEVRTRDALPQDWATTQNNLGCALQEKGVRSEGEERRHLLRQALAAYEQSLTVLTKYYLPELWAIAYRNLGEVFLYLGRHDGAATVFAELGEPVPELAGGVANETREPGES